MSWVTIPTRVTRTRTIRLRKMQASATNDYTGGTVVDAGTLAVSGSLSGTTNVQINNGGTLVLNQNRPDITSTTSTGYRSRILPFGMLFLQTAQPESLAQMG